MSVAATLSDTDTGVVLQHLTSAPVNLHAICDGLKVPVYYEPMTNIAGKLERDDSKPRGFRIVVNSLDHPNRQRFTLAHEIAHFVLHRDLVPNGLTDNAMYRSNLSDQYERQADRYAASVLLPADLVRKEFRAKPSLAHLSKLFQVSDAALRIRLKELRLDA